MCKVKKDDYNRQFFPNLIFINKYVKNRNKVRK